MEDHTARGSGLAHIHYIVILKTKKGVGTLARVTMHRFLSRKWKRRKLQNFIWQS